MSFNIRDTETVSTFAIEIRGSSEAMQVLVTLAKANGWQLYDCSASWIDLNNPSYAGWEGYDRLRRVHFEARDE